MTKNIAVDHGWYAERTRATLAVQAEALGRISNLMAEHPTGFAPQIHAELVNIMLSASAALRRHHDDTPSDFTRCPVCGHKPEVPQ